MFTGGAQESLARTQQAAFSSDTPTDRLSGRTAALQLAALDLTRRLTDGERHQLRTAGELPDWFDSELKKRAREKEKQRRQSR